MLHFREFLYGGGAGGEHHIGGEQGRVTARGQRLPDFDAVSHDENFYLRGEALHPEGDGREIEMRGENDAWFFSGVVQRSENEAQLGTVKATEGNFIFARREFVNARWIVEAQQGGGPAFLGRNVQQGADGLAAHFLNAADAEQIGEEADELHGLGCGTRGVHLRKAWTA